MTARQGLTRADMIAAAIRMIESEGLHGFISQEEAGCFRHFPADVSDSYKMAVQGFILLYYEPDGYIL